MPEKAIENRPGALYSTVSVIALVLETLLLLLAARNRLAPLSVLTLHLAIVAAMALAFARSIYSGTDAGFSVLALLATLATGPFGAAGALLMPGLTVRGPQSDERLAAWYDRIALSARQDSFTQTSDRIAIGRAADLASPPPAAFDALFHGGAISGQQTALGIIARSFDPTYLPMLKIALESPEPVIRVQAAAVAARIRTDLGTETQRLIARAADPTLSPADATSLSHRLEAAIASGLLEEKNRVEATRVRDAVLARMFARFDAHALASQRPAGYVSREAIDAYMAHLLATNRLADFRVTRSRLRRPVRGRYRSRIVRPRPATAALSDRLQPILIRHDRPSMTDHT